MQNRTFDPGGSQGHLRACPFLGSWRALVCGEVIRAGAAGDELQRFIGGDSLAFGNKAGFDAVQEKVKPSRAARGDKSEERRSRRRRRLEVIGRGAIGCWGTR